MRAGRPRQGNRLGTVSVLAGVVARLAKWRPALTDRIPPLSKSDQVMHSLIAIVVASALVVALVVLSWPGRSVLIVAAIAGVIAMRKVRRLSWGVERGEALRPIPAVLVMAWVAGFAFHAPLVWAASLGAGSGLVAYSYGCNFRSGRLRVFGLWPRP
jgi:hypothetical protein